MKIANYSLKEETENLNEEPDIENLKEETDNLNKVLTREQLRLKRLLYFKNL